MKYCPLNIYSGYSFLSSSLKVEDIFKICDKLEIPYFGICDLLNMHALNDIEEKKSSYKVNPLYGSTIIYLVNDEFPLYLSLYASNEKSYQNLVNIISYYPKGIKENELIHLKEDLVCIVPTISNSEILALLKDHDLENLKKEIDVLKNGFRYFYLGIEQYSKDDLYLTNLVRTFAKENNLKLVAFNKHLYLAKQDALNLSILEAIKNNTKLNTKQIEGPYFFLSEKGLYSLYKKEEIENTIEIANICKEFVFLQKRGHLLSYPINENKKEYIYKRCINVLKEKSLYNEEYLSRLKYELNIIEKMGYLDYFLIVQDYVNFAKNNNIPVGPGRGSSAGSLISYLLNITEVDPLKYDLLFERFLNPKRTSMPDIDVDFADYKRDEVVKYIFSKYGLDRCCNIITFQQFGPKQAIRDIGRVFSINNNDINTLATSIKNNESLKDAYKNSPSFKELCKDDYFLDIVKLAKRIEGLPRQASIHAAGIIINNNSLYHSLPLNKENDTLISQIEAPLLEKLNYLKMDILGLTNLTIIENMQKYLKKEINVNLDDQKTFSILNKGLTGGIFQLESSGITKSLKEVRINSFNDLVALLALYRPGPMDNIPLFSKNKNEHLKINYLHPSLEKILSPTYGVIVYQEQIMQIVQIIASYDLGKADLFRRAISKKDINKLSQLKDDFITSSINNHIDKEIANKIFNLIYKFANYGFNKAHSVSYALISYKMAYIKANYSLCYYASILNHYGFNNSKSYALINELNEFNIELHLPSISKSQDEFVIEDNYLYIPFTFIKGINKNIVQELIRIQKEKISSFFEFMKYASNINDDSLILLINAGVFDEYGKSRKTLLNSIIKYREYYQNISNDSLLTQDELLLFKPIIEDINDDENEKYEKEYQVLNILLSGSLFSKYKDKTKNILPLYKQINNLNVNTTIAVIINKIKIIKTKKKLDMAILTCQDDTLTIEVIIFTKAYQQYKNMMKENKLFLMKGYFRQNETETSFILDELINMEE